MRRPQVVVFGFESIEPFSLIDRADMQIGLFGQRQVTLGVPALHLRRFAAFQQALPGVLVHGLQHAEARLAMGGLGGLDQAVVEQGLQTVEDLVLQGAIAIADGFGHVERPAAGEDRQPAEQFLRISIEQIVTPFDGVVQRLLTFRHVARGALEHVRVLLQAFEQHVRREDLAARRGQLDG